MNTIDFERVRRMRRNRELGTDLERHRRALAEFVVRHSAMAENFLQAKETLCAFGSEWNRGPLLETVERMGSALQAGFEEVLGRLLCEPQQQWVPIAERLPTARDADEDDCVWLKVKGGPYSPGEYAAAKEKHWNVRRDFPGQIAWAPRAKTTAPDIS